ncbi:MAG: MGH1-like glycoside hydrolase domain-containing protein, partial [Verrucomicrobiota bacterium]
EQETLDSLPGFKKRFEWFLRYRADLARQISWTEDECQCGSHRWLLALPNKDRLVQLLRYALDPSEFLSPHGIRSLSKVHEEHPFELRVDGCEFRVSYEPGESTSGLFGGNSNWRGPVWFPINYLLIEALERYHHYYGEDFTVECPTGSRRMCTLREAARELSRRLASLFLTDAEGRRPCHGGDDDMRRTADGEDLLLFHEFFHGETGRGLGASHQTGWTALVARCLQYTDWS